MIEINNQAVINIEDYYKMRQENEALKTRAIQLEKGEIRRLEETIKELKIGLIMVLTKGRGGMEMEPPYEVTTEGQQLIVTIKSNTIVTDKFNDVKVKIR